MIIEAEIIKLLLVVFSVFGYCFLFKKFFKQQLGFSLVFTITAITTLLFFCSLAFGNIYYLAKLFYYLGLLFFLYILRKIFFNKSQNQYQIDYDLALETFLSPLFILFILVSLYFYGLFKGSYYSFWDDFSHWGTAAKEIFIKNRLFKIADLKNNFTADLFYNYPPASPLAQYYITKNIFTEFNEGSSKAVNAILNTIPLFFCFSFFEFKEKKIKDWTINFCLYLAIFILFKIYLLNLYLYFIVVDVLLGLYFGVLISAILFYKKETKADFYFFILFLFSTSFFITTIKHSGFSLCFLSLPLIFIAKNSFPEITKNKYSILFLQISVILSAIFLAKYLWLHNVGLSQYATMEQNKNFDIFNLSGKDLFLIRKYFEKSLGSFLEAEFLTTKFILLLLSCCYLYNLIYNKNNNKKTILILTLYIIGIYIIYCLGLLLMYLTQMPNFEAFLLGSYNRYLYTIIAAISLFLLVILIKNLSSKFLSNSFIIIIFIIFLLKIDNISYLSNSLNKKYLSRNLNEPTIMVDSMVIRQNTKDDVEFIKNLGLNQDQIAKTFVLFHNFSRPECNYFSYEISPYYSQDSLQFCQIMLQQSFAENINDKQNRIFRLKSAEKALYYYPFADKYVEINFIETAKKHELLFIPRADKDLWKIIGKYFAGNNYQNHKFFSYDKKLDKFIIYQTKKNAR